MNESILDELGHGFGASILFFIIIIRFFLIQIYFDSVLLSLEHVIVLVFVHPLWHKVLIEPRLSVLQGDGFKGGV